MYPPISSVNLLSIFFLYFVLRPCRSTSTDARLDIDSTSLWKALIGSSCQIALIIVKSSSSFFPLVVRCRYFCFINVHSLSMGFLSGDRAGQNIVVTLVSWRYCLIAFAMCGPKLSCCRINCSRSPWTNCANGKIAPLIIFLYFTLLNLRWIQINSPFPLWLNAPHTLTDLLPDLKVGFMQSNSNRSPFLRKQGTLFFVGLMLKVDSWVNCVLDHFASSHPTCMMSHSVLWRTFCSRRYGSCAAILLLYPILERYRLNVLFGIVILCSKPKLETILSIDIKRLCCKRSSSFLIS